jgi:hypothetical protein
VLGFVLMLLGIVLSIVVARRATPGRIDGMRSWLARKLTVPSRDGSEGRVV